MGWLGEQGATLAVCEPTGGYERGMVRRLREVGIGVALAHPNRVRAFARAGEYEAKTDLLDAQVLAKFGRVFCAEETGLDQVPEEPGRAELQELLRRRNQLVEQRVQERNRLDKGVGEATRASIEGHLAWLEGEIARLNREYQEALQRSSTLAQRAELYRSVPGIGQLTAATLVADLPELATRNRAGKPFLGRKIWTVRPKRAK